MRIIKGLYSVTAKLPPEKWSNNAITFITKKEKLINHYDGVLLFCGNLERPVVIYPCYGSCCPPRREFPERYYPRYRLKNYYKNADLTPLFKLCFENKGKIMEIEVEEENSSHN